MKVRIGMEGGAIAQAKTVQCAFTVQAAMTGPRAV